MLKAIEAYLVLRRAAGFALQNDEYLLKSFAGFAAARFARGHRRAHAGLLVPFARTDPGRRVLAARRKAGATDSLLTPAASLFPRPG